MKLEALRGSHELLSVMAGPQTLGWPVRRPRCFSCGLNTETVTWIGPTGEALQKDFEAFFAAAVSVSADCFLAATDQEVHDEQCRLAKI